MAAESLPQQLEQRDAARMRTYRDNLAFYGGAHWPGTPRRRERRLTFNYVRTFVHKVTATLLAGMHVAVEPADASSEAEARAAAARRVLLAVSEANDLQELDFETELDAAVLGDGCYKVTWEPDAVSGAGPGVRITSPDVQGLFAWWVGDDVSRVWRVASRYRLTAEEAGLLYGVTPSGAEAVVVEAWTAESFSLWVGNDLMEERPNPYGFIPFIVFPNLREPKQFWGSADITALMEPQREINRAFSQLSTILELSGNPIAVLEGVEEAQDIAVQPGAVWEVPERARAYLLDLLQGGGVRLHTEYIELLYRVLHDLSETPRTAFGDSGRNLSGVALEMELYPMVQRVARKRLQRNSVYRLRAELALRVHQQRTGEECWPVRLRTTWGTALPQDRDRLVQQEERLVNAGLQSRRRAMANVGIADPEGELSRVREEGER
ncbi:MAG: phage portal protein [Chloroflexota bacterium]|nr:phage portal protein [Chloroflexota bacterium]MDE2968846.1 phage portal protein [Chloroflexota bacterium]